MTSLTRKQGEKASRFFYDPLYDVIHFKNLASSTSLRAAMELGLNNVVSKSITPFLDCPEVSRMRWLRQAGLLSLVFPSANHDRFSHSLGTVHLGQFALQCILVSKAKEIRTLMDHLQSPGQKWIPEFLVALFLHDVGHYPFSHLLEGNFGLRQICGSDLVSHEDIACQLIMGKGPIYDAYRKSKFCSDSKSRMIAAVFDDFESGKAGVGGRSEADPRKQLSHAFDRNLICALIGKSKNSLFELNKNGGGDSKKEKSDAFMFWIMKQLVDGANDLDKLDHYKRDLYNTGIRLDFSPEVLIRHLNFDYERWEMGPTGHTDTDLSEEAQSEARSLLFCQNQLNAICFSHPGNLMFSSFLGHAVTRALLDAAPNWRKGEILDHVRKEGLELIVKNDGELLAWLRNKADGPPGDPVLGRMLDHIGNAQGLVPIGKIVNQAAKGDPAPTFRRNLIEEKIYNTFGTDNYILAFSKYFDDYDRPKQIFKMGISEEPLAPKRVCYVFSLDPDKSGLSRFEDAVGFPLVKLDDRERREFLAFGSQ